MVNGGSFGFWLLILLLYIVFKPFAKAKIDIQNHSPHSLKLQFSKSGSYTKEYGGCS
jgi:manganese transport protein